MNLDKIANTAVRQLHKEILIKLYGHNAPRICL